MSPRSFLKPRRAAVLGGVLFLAVGCSDETRLPTSPDPEPEARLAGIDIGLQLTCEADVASGTLSCGTAEAARGGISPQDVTVGNGVYSRMVSTNVVNDGTTLSADVRVQNLLAQAMGTPDGTTSTGVIVFFHSGPTNGVTVANPDGRRRFTAANQPFFRYEQILQPLETSAPRTWRFNLNGASSFTFTVLIRTKLPDESVVLPFAQAAQQVGAGREYACALRNDGRAFCWGLNSQGQLGNGTNASSLTPVPVAGGLTFTSLSVAQDYACALTASGQAYCWGDNQTGQLGDGTTTSRNVPAPVAGGLVFTGLDAGLSHACGITSSGAAHCWGSNGVKLSSGVLGRQGALGTTSTETCAGQPCSTTPVPVSGGHAFTSISTGLWSTCGTASGGAAYCWGWGRWGQLGIGSREDSNFSPLPVAGGIRFASASVGATYACGISPAGVAYCWGGTLVLSGGDLVPNYGQLGNGSIAGSTTPVPVAGGLTFTSVSAMDANNIYGHTCAVAVGGAAYCWGANREGGLGFAASEPCRQEIRQIPCVTTPGQVSGTHRFTQLATGMEFTCGVSIAGAVYCWGRNDTGQLGDGTTSSRVAPGRVTGLN